MRSRSPSNEPRQPAGTRSVGTHRKMSRGDYAQAMGLTPQNTNPPFQREVTTIAPADRLTVALNLVSV